MRHAIPLRLLAALAATLLMAACGSKTVLHETHALKNGTWLRFEPEKYTFEIRDMDACYDLTLTARVDTALLTDAELPLIVDMYNETSERRMLPLKLRLRDAHGQATGRASGAYREVSVPVREYFFFNTKGQQRVEVKQATSRYELRGVNALTLTVKESDLRDR